MHRTRLLVGFLLGISAIGLAATYYPGGLGRFYGDSVLTNLTTGAVYLHTTSNAFFVGGISSNPVKVGIEGVATTNDINAATASLASTSYVNSAVAGYLPTNAVFGVTTNLAALDLSTNALTLYFTNGTLRGVSSP